MKMKLPGADLADYRAQTERQKAMAGVMSPSFRCVACGRSSTMKGSKRTAAGTICEKGKIAREARKAQKAIKEAA